MDEPTKLEVIIGGRTYTLQGGESEEYFQQLAWYLDKKIAEAKRVKPMTSTIDLSTMHIIINIVDDLFKQRVLSAQSAENVKSMEEELKRYSNEISKLTDENLLLKERLSEATVNCNNARSELNDYIENFDKGRPAIYRVKTERKQ